MCVCVCALARLCEKSKIVVPELRNTILMKFQIKVVLKKQHEWSNNGFETRTKFFFAGMNV